MPKLSIAAENTNAGTPSTVWDISVGSGNIEGFATDISVNSDGTQTVNFKINTNSSNYRIDIYRMGYYQGNGARFVASSSTQGLSYGTVSILRKPSPQPAPFVDSSIGLCDAGNWSVSASWAVPATAVSGVYIAHLVRQDATSGENHIPFIVRDDGAPHDIVFQTSDTTWHAYNGWGGYNLYGGGAANSNDGRGFKVSYNRPIATRDGVGTYAGPQDHLFGVEIAAIHWLEANGYDVCYMSGVDTDRLDSSGNGGQIIGKRKVFLSVGHDEYWSKNQRANVEAARNAGVHLAFWSGNEVFWKTRYESSASSVTTDGSPTANRTLVCYKETRQDQILDPLDSGSLPTCTCTWRDPRFSPPGTGGAPDAGTLNPKGDGGKPEIALTGTIFQVDDFREDQILIPYPMTQLRFWRNTAVQNNNKTPGSSGSLVKNYLGYEWDESPSTGYYGNSRPAGLIHLSLTTVSVNTYLVDYGHTEAPAAATHSLSLYRHSSGALVFGAGTVMWSWGLDPDHDPDPKDPTQTPTDPNVKQAMVNLLADMGVLAQTLQSGLVAATKSTDTTAPTSTITSPTTGATLIQNQTVTITGTASDAAGQVGVVEVSTDGGNTWQVASGTTSWTYNWAPSVAGSATIKSRAVDDSLNLETPGPGVSVTVAAGTGVSLFSGSDAPSVVSVNDPNSVELGVKFQSSQGGTITGIRFYKGPNNTGTHVGRLWSSSGSLLSPAVTFNSETSSGWQQVNLSSPVSITAGTTYVVSYHTPGNYSADNSYFSNSPKTNGPLTAPVSGGASGGNGVYAYGSTSVFPTNTFLGSNYWVDVVFNAGGGPQAPVANNDSAVTTQNSPVTIQVLANDTPQDGSLKITGVGTPANGSVSFTPSAVTYTPASNYTGPDSFTYTIANSSGSASATVSMTVNPAGGTSSSLFSPTSAPGTMTDNDPSAVELGVKFQSSVAGRITAIRFYKGPNNTGTHTARLWSSSGTLLIPAVTFTNETGSGWQQVSLPGTGFAIQANTTYVASYHTSGFYSSDVNYFTAARTNQQLTALASGSSGGNGVYAYGSTSVFPTNTYQASNYWVDVVFTSP